MRNNQMTTETNQTQPDRRLRKIILAGSALLLGVAIFAFWYDYRLAADRSLIGAAITALATYMPDTVWASAGHQAQLMGLPLTEGSHAYWYLARAGGVAAYLLLWLATCWGIMMSSKVIKGVVDVPVAYALHEYLPILGVVFAIFHAVVLLGDSYIQFAPWQLLVPFAGPYKPLWTGMGILSLYLSAALIASFYIRKRIGQKTWRALHYTSYLSFLLALLHGVMAGSDSGTSTMQVTYAVTGGFSVFLLLYRMLAYAPHPQRSFARTRQPISGD
jgi:DMSO/TMAO reductase YedYZ heme-binding membrane subunit